MCKFSETNTVVYDKIERNKVRYTLKIFRNVQKLIYLNIFNLFSNFQNILQREIILFKILVLYGKIICFRGNYKKKK